MRHIDRPQPDEHSDFMARYIARVPAAITVLAHLHAQGERTAALFRALPADRLTTPYRDEPGEWTLQDILLHIIDTERVFSYRALRIGRGDTDLNLPGYDQDAFARVAHANTRTLDSLVTEYSAVRAATLALFDGLPDEALTRTGSSNSKPLSPRAAAYIIAGHELWHLDEMHTNYGVA